LFARRVDRRGTRCRAGWPSGCGRRDGGRGGRGWGGRSGRRSGGEWHVGGHVEDGGKAQLVGDLDALKGLRVEVETLQLEKKAMQGAHGEAVVETKGGRRQGRDSRVRYRG